MTVTKLATARQGAARPRLDHPRVTAYDLPLPPGPALPPPALAARAVRSEQEVLPHLAQVYTAALCLAGDPAEAENLVVETFVRAYAAFLQRQPVTEPQAWLYRILIGACRQDKPT